MKLPVFFPRKDIRAITHPNRRDVLAWIGALFVPKPPIEIWRILDWGWILWPESIGDKIFWELRDSVLNWERVLQVPWNNFGKTLWIPSTSWQEEARKAYIWLKERLKSVVVPQLSQLPQTWLDKFDPTDSDIWLYYDDPANHNNMSIRCKMGFKGDENPFSDPEMLSFYTMEFHDDWTVSVWTSIDRKDSMIHMSRTNIAFNRLKPLLEEWEARMLEELLSPEEIAKIQKSATKQVEDWQVPMMMTDFSILMNQILSW